MDFKYLDNESEQKLKEFLSCNNITYNKFNDRVIENLINLGYLKGEDISPISEPHTCYVVIDITQKGKSYFEMKKRYEKEQKRITHKDWWIAIISALIGALIGLIPTIAHWIETIFQKK